MIDTSDNTKLYGSFVLAVVFSFVVVVVEYANSVFYSYDLLIVHAWILLCVMLCLALGCVTNTKTRIIILCFVIALCVNGFMLYNIISSIFDPLKFILILTMYAGIGWYPTTRWINGKYGFSVRIMSSIAIGNIIFTIISTSYLVVFGLKVGGILTLLTALALCSIGLGLIHKNRNRFKEKLLFTVKDAQIVGSIILILIIHAVFLNPQYPHGAPLGYLRFMQDVLSLDKFPPTLMYGGFERNAHFAVLSVPPLLAHFFQVNLDWASYFEIAVGLGALLISVYLFSRLVISDMHSAALFSMVFVALLGEMHLYREIISCLSDDKGVGSWILNGTRSRTAPMFQPFALAAYIDNGKSWATMLLAYYLILSGNKNRLALFFAGTSVMVMVGGGQEEVLFGFVLAGIFILVANYRHYFQYRWNYSFLLLGCIFGAVIWFYLTAHKGSLQVLGGQGAIFIRPLSDWGLYLYHNWIPGGAFGLDIPLADFHVLFSQTTVTYILLEWAILTIFCFFAFRARRNYGFKRVRVLITLALVLVAMVPFFVGTNLLAPWNLNRLIQPFLFWAYMWAGVGFVYIVMKFKKISILPAGTIILLIVFYPTIHFANRQFMLAINRVLPSINSLYLFFN